MDAIEKARKYFGKGGYFELTDEEGNTDTFLMMPIPIERTAEQWTLQARIREKIWNSRKEKGIKIGEELSPEESAMVITTLDKDTFSIVLDLCYVSIENSKDFEGLSDDEKKSFVSANVSAMMPKLFEINDFGESHIKGDIEAIKRKEHIKRFKDAANERESA